MGGAEVPLLETKLHPPRTRRRVVARPRLGAQLDLQRLPALTLVSAPAGFGKTTVLVDWLGGAPGDIVRTAWVSLDSGDNDPHVFWSYLVAALRAVAPELGDGTTAPSPRSLDTLVATLLNDLISVGDELVVVLDDYHVIESDEVHGMVRFLVDHLPAHVHVLLASRADPPWPLAGRRARGDLLELRAADLRFTTAETAAYLNDVMNLTLTAEEVDALEARTEGWIAALQLAGLSMQGRDDVTAFIDSFAGDDRFILDYLVDEVVDRQADDVRTFLLQTAILSRLSAPLCDAVTGQASSKATLALLERANLFLIPLDDRRIWYRYHHLFADVLHARLLDEEPTSVAPLHRRASDWYAQHGDSHEAIRHAMAAHDVERAAELIELAVAAMRQARQEVTLRNWIEALPSELLATRPVLRVGLVGARMASGRFDDVEPTLDDVEQWLDAADRSSGGMVVVDEAEFVRLPAQVAMYRAARSLITGDIPATIAYADRARQLADDDDHLGRGAAAALVGLAQWTLGDLEAAERRYSEAIACFVPAEHHADVLGCTVSLADIQVAQGRLGAAMHTLESVRDIASRHGALRGAADMHVGVAEVLLQRNDLDGARAQLQAAGELGAAAATSQYAYRWRVARACLLELDGDATGALDLLAEAARLYDTDFSPPIRPVPAVIARMQVGQGDLAPALAWAIDRGLAVDDDLTYVHEYEHITLARILLAQGAADPSSAATDDAVRLLRGLLAAAEQGQRTGSVVEILALQALAHDARGDTAAAMGALEQALSGAQGEGFIRVFLDGGAPMARLLRTAVDRGVAVDQARRLLAAGGFTTPEPSARALPPGLVEPLSPRELEILRLLRTDLSGPDIARELTVSLNTVRTHTKNIYTKLGVNNRRAAVRRAAELGL